MKTSNNALIDELLTITQACTVSSRELRSLSEQELNFKPDTGTWSVLECLEHLNRYGDFYLPVIEEAMLSGARCPADSAFKSGLIGNYFAHLMKVRNGKVTKMKSPPDKNPSGSVLSATTIDRFLKQQALLEVLLQRGREADLTGIRVPISLTRLIRLRLGDTFRFFVYHIERHVQQAQRAAKRATQDSVALPA